MAEVKSIHSAAAWSEHRESPSTGLGGSQLFTIVETALGPLVLVFSLWVLALHFESTVRPAYLILSLIVFSLTFPGSSQLRLPIGRVLFNIVFQWLWVAGVLLLTGYATQYLFDFSRAVVGTWLWVAPSAQIGAHLIFRGAAPYLLKLQGPP
ncbi:MAG: undecaprenyl-phosphate glucose phosphotransferase, partial [Rhodoferax sp.]